MKDLKLVPISLAEIDFLDKTEYKSLSREKRKLLVQDAEKGLCRGQFFRFYLIKNQNETIGLINMFGHGSDTVSVAPEIIESYRKKGYAVKSLTKAYELAKELNFKHIIADIREENIASQKLHEKLGFTLLEETVNKNGNLIKKYFKFL